MFVVLTQCTKYEDIEKIETFHRYMELKTKPLIWHTGLATKPAPKNARELVTRIKGCIDRLIKNEVTINGFTLTKNKAEIIRDNLPAKRSRKFKPRTKEEVEVWVNSMTNLRDKVLFMLYSLGLRNHEPRVYRVNPNHPEGEFAVKYVSKLEKDNVKFRGKAHYYNKVYYLEGLRIEQIDFEQKCIHNLLRKGRKDNNRIQGRGQLYLMLDDITCKALKLWIENRVKYYPEIQENPSLSQFVFPFLSTNFVSKISTSHFNYLKNEYYPEIKERIQYLQEQGLTIPILLKMRIKGIALILKNGTITPHQLRHTWITLAKWRKMDEEIRRYHVGHSFEGMDDVYVDVPFMEYRQEFDEKAPKFNFILEES